MKLILIEDEPESLLGMKKAVESIDMEYKLFTSNNGEDALHIIQQQWPELIVTDIMLPYMTGIELVEQITTAEYQPKVIIVSGYNDFEYVRSSIRIGAVDYFLKPFRTEEFTEKIRKALLSIQMETIQHRELQQQKTFADIGYRMMRDDYLIGFCLKRTALEEHLYQRLCLWEIEWLANQTYSLMVMDLKGHPDGKPPGHDSSLETFAIGNIAQELLKNYSRSILFKDPQNRWVILSSTENMEELGKTMTAEIKRYQKFQLALGISSKMSVFEDIHAAYNEALKPFRINSLSDQPNYFYQNKNVNDDLFSPNAMAIFIYNKDKEMIQEGVGSFIRYIALSGGSPSREDMIRKILNYLSQVHVCLSKATSRELEELPMKVWETFDECRTIEECEGVLNHYLIHLSAEMSSHKLPNAMIERAIHIISTRYMEDLTLQIIADQLSIHPVWLSQLFKKETGQTYLDYLTKTRVERAKVFLRESSLKIYEIAESIGYHDVQHFGQIFKKRIGQTPKEYRYGK